MFINFPLTMMLFLLKMFNEKAWYKMILKSIYRIARIDWI